ncbi:MAG: sulfotransferase [Betaproteobacteria bacterium]
MTEAQQGAAKKPKPGRNDPCPCGSGRKFKLCCATVESSGETRAAPADIRAAQGALARAAGAEAAGRVEEAIAALHQAVALDPRNPAAALELGKLLLGNARPREALPWLERAVGLLPGSSQAHLQKGLALEQLGWHAEAAEAYRQAIKLTPRLAKAHARLGVVLMVQEMRAEAAASFRRAAKLAPNETVGRLSGAYAFLAEDAVEDAESALRSVIAAEPGSADAHAELGKLLAETGKAEEAHAVFDRVVRLNPRAAGHYYDLVRIRRLTEADRPLLDQMLAAARRDDLHDLHRIMLELAVGKAYDDLGDPEQAMRHYVAGNQLKGRMRPLDRDLIKTRMDWQIRTFTREFFASNNEVGSPDCTPILVLGMPRSGTTLVESVLACHSQVGAGQELAFWNQRGREMMEARTVPLGEAIREIAESYHAVLRGISEAPHVTDKKPDNFVWAGLVHLVFPHARIVHCRRDPLDTCVSILGNFFAPRPDFSTEPGDLVFYYHEYERMMAHWREVLPADHFLELDYEELVANPEPAIRRLLEFCSLDWEPACLHPERSTRTVNTASLWQVRQPIFKGSVGRWRRYASWLGELSALMHAEENGIGDAG